MSRRFITYILSLFAVVLQAACVNDYADGSDSGPVREFSGTIALDLTTPDVTSLTRSLNTESGAQILVEKLWVGVFDIATGECIGAARYDNMNKVMQSGTLVKNMLTVNFMTQSVNLPLAYIVAVANYDGVKTWEGRLLTDLLPGDNHSDFNWDKLINIGIDTDSAYAGNKGADENVNAPFMAGFFQDAVSLTQNPKIDQFAYTAPGPATIYPESAANGIDVDLGDGSDDKNNIYVPAGAICLRRLVSHNTVRVNTSNGYEVTGLKYKRFNMPRAVYMLQRRTDVNRYDSFSEWQRHSPNYADLLLAEGQYDSKAERFPYACDDEWHPVEISSWDSSANVEFSFEHFENKHWGSEWLRNQSDREALNPDGTFAALCSGGGDGYNNFASYFVLSLHIINKTTGESADVEYTLHEGYCNNADGRVVESAVERCRDFTSLRNVRYTYNINISGLEDITTGATSQDGSHYANGQSGTVWKMYYANEASKTIPIAGGTFNFGGKYLTFSGKPDLGFRICGRDASGGIVDICYNMPEGMYDGFAGLWPGGTPQYVDRPDDSSIPSNLLNDMKISSGSTDYTLSEFVKGVQSGSIPPTGSYSFKFAAYDNRFTGLTGNLVRGLYIFDRNDTQTDADGCSYNIAYGADQYPFASEKVKFDAGNILWDNIYYKMATTVANVFAAESPIFYGCENSKIDLRWRHDPRFAGYQITVFNDSYTHPTIVVGPDKIDRYLHDLKGEQIFIYPLNTVDLKNTSTATNYSFSVLPIVTDEIFTVEGPTVVAHNTSADDTCIRVCQTTWNISSTRDWKDLNLNGKNNGTEVHYRGLNVMTTSNIAAGSKGSFICFGGAGDVNNRYFSFWASVPGTFAVTCNSHSGVADVNRKLIIARMDDNGGYDEIYNSNTMAGSQTTYQAKITPTNGQPTEFRIYALGSIDYYILQFTPSN